LKSLRKQSLTNVFLYALMISVVAPAWSQDSPQQFSSGPWVGTWATAPMIPMNDSGLLPFSDVTLREIVHTSIGGAKVRVRFTNQYGILPLQIGNVHIALSAANGGIQPSTDHSLKFNSQGTVKIPAGAEMYSDPIDMEIPPLADVAVSFYLPRQDLPNYTYHMDARQTGYMAEGNKSDIATLDDAHKQTSWYFISGIDVVAGKNAGAVVAFGDSITDGAYSTVDANHRWPDYLARMLDQSQKTEQFGVLDEGIDGNRVLNDGWAQNALARFDRDVLAQSSVRYLIVLEGINDIGRLSHPRTPADDVSVQDLETGLTQLVVRAHAHNIKVIGATLTPYKGAGYYSEKGEAVREGLNQWIRSSGVFDGVADFDEVTRDPNNPQQFLPKFDHGDHLHPSDAGYEAMGNALSPQLLK
jgi:lysophospholipase L1-like esterase